MVCLTFLNINYLVIVNICCFAVSSTQEELCSRHIIYHWLSHCYN